MFFKDKKLIKFTILFIFSFNTFSMINYDYLSVDYLKLTRSDLPSARSVVSAAYENLDFNLESFKQRVSRIHSSALFPESVNLSYGHAPDSLSRYGYYPRTTISTNMSNGFWNNNSQTQHGALPNQFDTKKSLSLSVRWDLQKLFGFDGEELNTLADFINQIDQEGFALSQIARSYGQLISALPDDNNVELSESKIITIIEHAAILDTLSGGLISNVLRNKSDSYQPAIKNLNDDILIIVDESLNPNQNNIIEIRDGQDDGIEVIGVPSN